MSEPQLLNPTAKEGEEPYIFSSSITLYKKCKTGCCHRRINLSYVYVCSSEVWDKAYGTFKTDLSEKREYDTEILRCKTKW